MKASLLMLVCGLLAGCASYSSREVYEPSGVVVEPAGAEVDDWSQDARDKNQRPYGHQFEKKLPSDATPTLPEPP